MVVLRSGRACCQLLQIGLHVWRKAWMVRKTIVVCGGERELNRPVVREDQRQSAPGEGRAMKALVGEQAELGGEADVGQAQVVADQEGAIRLQRLVDAAGVEGEGLGRAGVDVGGEVGIAQAEKIDLAV